MDEQNKNEGVPQEVPQQQTSDQTAPQQTVSAEGTSSDKIVITALVVVVLLFIAIAVWYFMFFSSDTGEMSNEELIEAAKEKSYQGISAQVGSSVGEALPDVELNVNPIRGIYKNPFE